MIYGILLKGAENAMTSADLLHKTGIETVRELQKVIAQERAEGALILSNSRAGYFLPADGQKGQLEIAEFIGVLRNRAINTLKALKAAKAALDIFDTQLTFFEMPNEEDELCNG
jgi:hypothetical protein